MNTQIEFYENKLNYEMDAADLFDAISKKEHIVIVDTRKPAAYSTEHIPGSINLPHKNMNSKTTTNFDSSKTYVCYCDGIGCNASTRGALNMSKLGFKVKELIGGLDWWNRDGYQTTTSNQHTEKLTSCGC